MTLTSGRYIGHEYDRMIVLFSMQDRKFLARSRRPRWIMSSAARRSAPSSAKPNSSAYATASRPARPASIERRNLKEILGVSCCAASISEPNNMPCRDLGIA